MNKYNKIKNKLNKNKKVLDLYLNKKSLLLKI